MDGQVNINSELFVSSEEMRKAELEIIVVGTMARMSFARYHIFKMRSLTESRRLKKRS